MKQASEKAATPKAIDDYLAGVQDAHRAALQQLRETLHALVPGAQECIRYGLPTLAVDGRGLVAFGAGANHCALYPLSGRTVADFADALAGYQTSKGAIRFQPQAPLPKTLLRRLIKARLAEHRAQPPPRGARASRRTQS